jgi:hypothetical protein
MPYLTCPSCQHTGYVRTTRHGPDLCTSCGAFLPPRHRVIPLTRFHQRADTPPDHRSDAIDSHVPTPLLQC